MIYLDNHATTPCDPRVVDAMLPFFAERFGNPHSAGHAMGADAAEAVETAREQVAALAGVDRREIVFTSGATEANNLAIKGAARFAGASGPRRRIVTVATEHPCVLETVRDLAAEGFEPVVLSVGPDGLPDLDQLRDALLTPTLLVSVMAANNETGIMPDLGAVVGLAHAAGALVHSDAAQAAGRIPLDIASLGLDLVSLSAHKMYGPKGVGALYVRRRPRVRLAPLFSGGGQERGLRSGTLPAPLLVGFGAAAALAGASRADEAVRIASLRDRLLASLVRRVPGLVLNGGVATSRLPGNLNLRFPDVDATELMRHVPGVAMSAGSACGSAEIAPSEVLLAMGLAPAEARRSLRLGLGRFTSPSDVENASALIVDGFEAASGRRTGRVAMAASIGA